MDFFETDIKDIDQSKRSFVSSDDEKTKLSITIQIKINGTPDFDVISNISLPFPREKIKVVEDYPTMMILKCFLE